MSTLELKELSHPSGEVIKIAAGKTLDLKSQGSVTMPTGSVLQVVSVTKTNTFTTTSTSFVDVTGLSVSITPSSTSSKILVLSDVFLSNSGSTGRTYIKAMRDSTSIAVGASASSRELCSSYFYGTTNETGGYDGEKSAMTYLDSPSSTSALTYKMQIKARSGTATLNRNGQDGDGDYSPRTASTITVMEIQG